MGDEEPKEDVAYPSEEEPKQQEMAGAGGGPFPWLDPHPSLLVKQTTRGCLQECLGCTARSEYKVSEYDKGYMQAPTGFKSGFLTDAAFTVPNIFYLDETSGCCWRLWWQEGRPMEINMSEGGEAGGRNLAKFAKTCTCQICVAIPVPDPNDPPNVIWVDTPMCCKLPYLNTTAPDAPETELTRTVYVCDLCLAVPKFDYYEGDQVIYRIKPATCCFGCCPTCKCFGRKRGGYPMYLYDPTTGERLEEGKAEEDMPQVTKVWAGLKKECCTTADNFLLIFPEGSSNLRKGGLVGAAMLIDLAWFEGHN
jgi:hypothetical protein